MTPPNAGKDVEQQELSFIPGRNAKLYSHFGRQGVSYKTKHILISFSNLTPWYLPKGVENLCPHKNLCMFIAALFIIAITWKQPSYPSVGEWINCCMSRP